MKKNIFKSEVNRLGKLDQQMRKGGSYATKKGIEVDRNNLRELKKLMDKFGFPTIEKVGKNGHKYAWLIIQHSPNIVFQKKMLKQFEIYNKSNPNKLTKMFIAYLTDRILIKEIKKQKFGTQFRITKNRLMVPYPFIKETGIEKLRREYGLSTLKSYLASAERENKLRLAKK